MKEFQNLNQEEQVDLRIVEHLDMQNLPESIQNMLLTIADACWARKSSVWEELCDRQERE